MDITTGQRTWRHRSAAYSIAVAIIAGLSAFGIYEAVAGSSEASGAAAVEEPALVEPLGESGFSRITLTPSAVKRLNLQTAVARSASVGGNAAVAVPYSAVLYDPDGKTWVYKMTKPRTFIRHAIAVASIEGARAFLSKGPAAGTLVATVGAQELFGAEHGVGATSGN